MNRCVFFGNIVAEPEFSYTKNGKGFCKARMAVSRRYKDASGEWQENSTFINLTAWEYAAEKIRDRCKKGTQVLVECEYQVSNYTDKNNVERQWHDFRVQSIELGLRAIPFGGQVPDGPLPGEEDRQF